MEKTITQEAIIEMAGLEKRNYYDCANALYNAFSGGLFDKIPFAEWQPKAAAFLRFLAKGDNLERTIKALNALDFIDIACEGTDNWSDQTAVAALMDDWGLPRNIGEQKFCQTLLGTNITE